jgi:hypothetical protein
MQIDEGHHCPILDKKCIQTECAWFIKLRGMDANSGKDIDEWNCAIAWLPMLNINTANEARKTCAATETFRNEMVKQNDITKLFTDKLRQLHNGE